MNWREFHHLYLGAALLVGALFLEGTWPPRIVSGIGFAILIDDAVQHAFQTYTPGARLNDWLWEHSRLYQRVVNGLDDLVAWITRPFA